ncbi:Hypothetical protein BN2458_PEG1550 [Helicobacter typhlonius]|uniref:Uncharacterized protein n=1 Tax=Helicobacter typhlonius TaxID=76936 RepID=A0A0S4PWL1_9HELI|nr:Hypothetical protein BN2458_PEG1550 [Helicobacter typhlonius]
MLQSAKNKGHNKSLPALKWGVLIKYSNALQFAYYKTIFYFSFLIFNRFLSHLRFKKLP